MTEDEAKALASELEHNHDWRVEGVFPILPHFWGVYLAHRRRAEWLTLTNASYESIQERLASRRSDITYTIDLK